MRSSLLLLFMLCAGSLLAPAQSFDATQSTQGVSTIDASWRFHPGDDPRWASPSFDDSSWPLLNTGSYWSSQGYRGYSGYAWFRLRLKLPATTQPLGIDIGHINSAAELYADGQLIGDNGIMRPKPDWSMQLEANAFPLPPALNGRWVEIAVRVWKSPVASSYSGGGFRVHPVVGSLALLQAGRRVAFDNAFADRLSALTVDLLTLVLGGFGLGLYLLDRRNTEYAWFAVWAIGTVLLDVLSTTLVLGQGSATFVDGDSQLLTLPLYLAEFLFLWGFLKVRRDWMLWTAVLFDAFAVAGNSLGYHNVISLPAGQAIMSGFFGLVFVLVIARVRLSLKAGSRDARLLIVPVCLMALGTMIEGVRQAIFFAGWSHNRGELVFWSNGIVTIDWNDVFTVLYLTSVGFALILRFTRSAQEERRLSTELAAAREVQCRLVPAELPGLRGLTIEAVYLPATEVGGDFYQVFPLPRESALIVIGDVSGKGLKAAMTGTLALGALRTLAQEDLRPAQILSRLNTQLTGSTDGGFVTCCVAHVASDGLLTLANAGHVPPYRNGEEVASASALPLGVDCGARYSETCVALEPGDRLTFMSDGVAEARNATGQLFGFERTAAISTEPAEEIAAAAQAFGQEDDITALSLTLTGAPAHA
jgi:phosphoserine phosphatase RsbU/P